MSFVNEHFKMLCEIGECIAKQFGDDCEVVLHDLTRSYDNTIVAIWNGHVTGRNVGDGGTAQDWPFCAGLPSQRMSIVI